MKLRNINYLVFGSIMALAFTSCSKEYLDVEPKGTYLEENYYSNETQAYSGLIAIYDVLGKESRGFENMVTMMNAGSDDHYAGGGGPDDGAGIHAFSNYSITASTIPASYWGDYYQGIFRANVLISKLPDIPMGEANRARFTAEAKALRGYFYFQLVRMFGNIPLIVDPLPTADIYNVEQASKEAVYAQIETDLEDAKSSLPDMVNLTTEAGRFSKGAVQALLGKVYLYDGKNAQAADELAEVNGTPGGTSKYGYRLLDNFADLWDFQNTFNSESILETTNTNQSNADWGFWGSGADEGNSINIMVGPRSYVRSSGSTAPDFAPGWSFNVFTQGFYDLIKDDPRFDATVADLKAYEEADEIEYLHGDQDTGYYLRKFMPLNSDATTGGGVKELNYQQHVYMIRLADTYLLEAEALGGSGVRAQALLDAVRARVGLPSVPVSTQAIWNERRLELAGEGHRWFDLVRTGNAASALSNRGFTAGKNEVLPIPLREMENTLIVQNPNY
ncbi:RagB/SusD family nutrient uptake outer membrane protein [Flagellimonas aequoris]|uniref:RagB/SusD family nutrient uptake outer membrane protein n=1 Tax=Flagellimonas aequoris TaxID=2306997 RepID=A0A418N2V4_9FLAO|nr:RagB/SusD family nutrient uptake outer membrane protein [Allomuricauda aequoris]RIV67636.1 RagB/SusD family nutrient uptake outer membrane protein [Allomuricauda aequoris]TXJ99461.1 RagB/SusD family nutrient uptake outer membrane protein [Allomuricauda aequoris]